MQYIQSNTPIFKHVKKAYIMSNTRCLVGVEAPEFGNDREHRLNVLGLTPFCCLFNVHQSLSY